MLDILGTAVFSLIVWSPTIIGIALIRSMN
jgi:hypothetical protein